MDNFIGLLDVIEHVLRDEVVVPSVILQAVKALLTNVTSGGNITVTTPPEGITLSGVILSI